MQPNSRKKISDLKKIIILIIIINKTIYFPRKYCVKNIFARKMLYIVRNRASNAVAIGGATQVYY